MNQIEKYNKEKYPNEPVSNQLDIRDALEIVTKHNEWRRGADTEMDSTTLIGVAIDTCTAWIKAELHDKTTKHSEALNIIIGKKGTPERNEFDTELNDGYIHEVLDRLHVATDTLDRHIDQHPLIEQLKKDNHELPKIIDKAIELLAVAYQITGNLDVKDGKVVMESNTLADAHMEEKYPKCRYCGSSLCDGCSGGGTVYNKTATRTGGLGESGPRN